MRSAPELPQDAKTSGARAERSVEALPPIVAAALDEFGDSLIERLQKIAGHSPQRERYTVLGEIARGGMGRVLRVWDEDLQREIALKEIAIADRESSSAEERAEYDRMVARFIDEARITGQLDHPGIVPVHEIAVDTRGSVYFTMPLVRGRDLRAIFALARAERDGWNLTRAVGVMLKVCEAVAFAHAKGVVHRDLKPANVMVGPFGEAYVMDWGLALVLGRAEGRRVVGTPAYMAPEQAQADPRSVGPRSDVYSLGAILYELLTGRMPHEASLEARHEPGALDDVLALPPRATLDAAPEAPRELAAICDKAMQPAPDARYATASALADDLRAWLEGRVVRAYESGTLPRLKKWVRRNRGLAAALQAFVGLAIASGVAVLTLQNSKLRAIAAESYTANVQAAALSLRMNETAQAKHFLAATDPGERGWEWRHLSLKADVSRSTIPLPAPAGAVAMAPDGSAFATACDDGTLRLYDEVGAELGALSGHLNVVGALAWSPDGSVIASGSEDRSVRLWSVGELLEVERFQESAIPSAVAFSPDGGALAAGLVNGSITIRELVSGRVTATLDAGDPTTQDVVFVGDDRLASVHSTGLRIWDLASGACVGTTAPRETALALAWDARGEELAVAAGSVVLLLDPETLATRTTLLGHEGPVQAIAFGARTGRLVSGSADDTVRVWDTSTGAELARLYGHDAQVSAVALHPDGRRCVSGSEDSTTRLWDLARTECTLLPASGEWDSALAIRGDGEALASAQGGTIEIKSSDDRSLLATLEVGEDASTLRFAPDGAVLAIGLVDGAIRLWDGVSAAARALPPAHTASVSALTFDADGERLLSRSFDRTARVFDVATGAELFAITGLDEIARTAALHPRGALLALGAVDGSIAVWDADTMRRVASLHAHEDEVTALAFDRSGTRLASGSNGGRIALWDTRRWVRVAALDERDSRITSLSFAPRGERIVSSSHDRTLRIWSPTSGRTLLTLPGHRKLIADALFTADGERIVSMTFDREVRVWRTAPAD